MKDKGNNNGQNSGLLKLVVGVVVVVLGIILFRYAGNLYKEAEEKDEKEKAERAEKIRELTQPDSLITESMD